MLFFADYGSIRRFALAAGEWLDPIPLPGQSLPNGLAVDEAGVWIATSTGVSHLDSTGQVLEDYALGYTRDLAVDGALLFTWRLTGDGLSVYSTDTGALLDSLPIESMSGLTVFPLLRRVVVSRNQQPYQFIDYTEQGALSDPLPPAPGQTFETSQDLRVFPDGRRFSDSAAQIWDAAERRYLDSRDMYYGGRLAVAGDQMVGLEYSGLRLFDASGVPIARQDIWQLPYDPIEIAVSGNIVWLFLQHTLEAKACPLAEFIRLPEEPPFDPSDLDYEIEAAEIGEDGVVYLLPRFQPHLFRWDATSGSYLPSIPLAQPAQQLAAVPGEGLLMLGGRHVARILPGGSPLVAPFATLPPYAHAVFAAGPWVGFLQGLRAQLLGPDGVQVDHVEIGPGPVAALWDAQRSRLLDLRRAWSPPSVHLGATEVSSEGAFGARSERDEESATAPLRLSPDGARLLAGPVLFDAATLDELGDVGTDVVDGMWLDDGRLLLIERQLECCSVGYTRYRELTGEGEPVYEYVLPGEPVRLLPFEDGAVLVRRVRERPHLARIAPGAADLDGDDVEDSFDVFPLDPSEWSDQDRDGVGDNADAFPEDYDEYADSDGDRIGDRKDHLPLEPATAFVELSGSRKLSISGVPALAGYFEGQLHFLAGGAFALCTERESCLHGVYAPEGRKNRFLLTLSAESSEELSETLEESARIPVAQAVGHPVELDLPLSQSGMRISLKLRTTKEATVARLRLRAPHRGRSPGLGRTRGAFVVRAAGYWSEPGAAANRSHAARPARPPS